MTRGEFIEQITSWSELLSFCYDYDCDVCADIISHDSLAEYIADDFRTFADRYSWTDIRGWLNDIDDDADYYYRNGSFEYESVDDDFDSYKDDVLSWGDDDGIWDPEDEDEEFDDYTPMYFGDINLAEFALDDTEDRSEADKDFVSSSEDELEEGCTAEELLGFLMNHFQYTVTE